MVILDQLLFLSDVERFEWFKMIFRDFKRFQNIFKDLRDFSFGTRNFGEKIIILISNTQFFKRTIILNSN